MPQGNRSPSAGLKRLRLSRRTLAGWLVATAVLGMAAVGQTLGLAALPYSTSLLSSASSDAALAPPTPDFSVGDVHWPVREIAAAPRLEPFRELFRANCAGRTGLAAAVCVSDFLAHALVRGVPTDEYVNPGYDPVASLRAQLAGAPGHCVNRTALLVTTLLAAGVPARVVQIVPPPPGGHHVSEVWDGARGWLLFDPSFGAVVGTDEAPLSAVGALASPSLANLVGVGISPRRNLPGATALYDARLFSGNVVYPEPWLYVRVGRRAAPWPFRGAFVRVGTTMFLIGPAQALLRWGILLAAAASLVFFGLAIRTLVRARTLAASLRLPAAKDEALIVPQLRHVEKGPKDGQRQPKAAGERF